MTATSFKEAYQTLQQHAETLRKQQEPNIDDLLTIVTESVAAYQICKERIDAVEKAMAQALSGANIDELSQPSAQDSAAAPEAGSSQSENSPDFGKFEDDIPF